MAKAKPRQPKSIVSSFDIHIHQGRVTVNVRLLWGKKNDYRWRIHPGTNRQRSLTPAALARLGKMLLSMAEFQAATGESVFCQTHLLTADECDVEPEDDEIIDTIEAR